MKLKPLLPATFALLLVFCSCKTHKPVATASHERIEERVKPIPINADTIEITLSRDARLVRPPKTSEASQTVDRRPLTVDNIKSSRGVSVKTTHTDSTQTLRITLQPDTIFVPYVHHIRSDTIVTPDPTTKARLTTARWQIVALILILIAITIILFIRQNDKKT